MRSIQCIVGRHQWGPVFYQVHLNWCCGAEGRRDLMRVCLRAECSAIDYPDEPTIAPAPVSQDEEGERHGT